MSAKDNETHLSSKKKLKVYFTLIVTLSFFFGLGWGFGLAATSSDIQELSFVLQLLFCIFVGSQGVLMFIFHCVRPQHVRAKWKSLYKKVMKHCISCFHSCWHTQMYPKSPMDDKNENRSNTYYNFNKGTTVAIHNTVSPSHSSTTAAMVLANPPSMDRIDQKSDATHYELVQSAPRRIQMSDSSESYDNPAYVSVSPPRMTQSLQHTPVVVINDRVSKKKVCPLDSNASTVVLDLDD